MTTGRENARDATMGTNLLVALLLRYPAIGSAYVDTNGKQLRLTFLVKDKGADQALQWHQHLQEMLDTYFKLERIEPTHCELLYEAHAGLGLLGIQRDLDSVRLSEITLIVEVIEEMLGAELRYEVPESHLQHDDQVMHEEWIGYMLENLQVGSEPQSLLAFREGGRVLVYNANKS